MPYVKYALSDMECKCWVKINKNLAKENLILCMPALCSEKEILVPVITTEWLDKTKVLQGHFGKSPSIPVSFCPFCGISLNTPK